MYGLNSTGNLHLEILHNSLQKKSFLSSNGGNISYLPGIYISQNNMNRNIREVNFNVKKRFPKTA